MTGAGPSAAARKLEAGLAHVEPLLERHGFSRVAEEGGSPSGGPFAAVTMGRGDRQLKLWLRYDSLSVVYRLGDEEIEHAALMRELLGPGGPNEFPPYADDAETAFSALRHDLECFCRDFLDGRGGEFRRCLEAGRQAEDLTGPQRLARIEEQLRRD
jgi:hypothetical protein